MSSSTVIRWGGLAGVLGGALWSVLGPLTLVAAESPILGLDENDYTGLLAVAALLLLISLVGLHVQHSGRFRWLGWTGSAISFLGLALLATGTAVQAWINLLRGGYLALLGSFVLGLGLMLFGIATIRAKVLPGWLRAAPLLLGILSPMQYIFIGIASLIFGDGPGLVLWVLFGLGWASLGHALWSDAPEPGLDIPNVLSQE